MLEETRSDDLRHVGGSPSRTEAAAKLTGQALYVSDMTLPGLLHA